jgi:SAM-dependent methyltransferase
MGREINLLKKYPRTIRKVKFRKKLKNNKSIKTASKFGREYFDGSRANGYGGYYYHPKYWSGVVNDFKNYYKLNEKSKILDIGCAKGFMLYEFKKILPKVYVRGIDVSSYAIKNAKPEVKRFLKLGNAIKLPFKNNFFDLVISINTIHNLSKKKCLIALAEINRVSKKNAFITVDAFSNEIEKKKISMWNLTAKSIFHVDEWINLFQNAGYKGDYYWFKVN